MGFGPSKKTEDLNDGSAPKKNRCKLIQCIDDFYNLIYEADEFLSADQASRLRFLVHAVLKRSAWLHEHWKALGLVKYQLMPKHHYFFHIALRAQGRTRNPRAYQTYIDESFVGRVCSIFERSQSGPYHDTIQKTVLLKYLTALNIHLSQD